ncbi:hypothetical protein Bca101_049808 [Brassica carinata]
MCVLAMSFRSKFSAPPLYPWKRNGLSTTSTNSHSRRRSSSSKSSQEITPARTYRSAMFSAVMKPLLSPSPLLFRLPPFFFFIFSPTHVAVLPTSKSGSKKALKCPWEYDLKYATHVCVQVGLYAKVVHPPDGPSVLELSQDMRGCHLLGAISDLLPLASLSVPA